MPPFLGVYLTGVYRQGRIDDVAAGTRGSSRAESAVFPTLDPMISAAGDWRGRSRTVRLLLVMAAFVGLFAMHGLGDHGTMHQELSAPMAAIASTDSHAGHVSMRGDPGVTGHVRITAPASDGASMAGLCIAVLGGAILALAWLRSRVPLRVVRRWPYRSSADLRATVLRDRDPPCLFELSIQRC